MSRTINQASKYLPNQFANTMYGLTPEDPKEKPPTEVFGTVGITKTGDDEADLYAFIAGEWQHLGWVRGQDANWVLEPAGNGAMMNATDDQLANVLSLFPRVCSERPGTHLEHLCRRWEIAKAKGVADHNLRSTLFASLDKYHMDRWYAGEQDGPTDFGDDATELLAFFDR